MPKFTQIRLVKIQKCDFLNDDILSSFSSGFIAYVVQDGPAFEFADKILQFCPSNESYWAVFSCDAERCAVQDGLSLRIKFYSVVIQTKTTGLRVCVFFFSFLHKRCFCGKVLKSVITELKVLMGTFMCCSLLTALFQTIITKQIWLISTINCKKSRSHEIIFCKLSYFLLIHRSRDTDHFLLKIIEM